MDSDDDIYSDGLPNIWVGKKPVADLFVDSEDELSSDTISSDEYFSDESFSDEPFSVESFLDEYSSDEYSSCKVDQDGNPVNKLPHYWVSSKPIGEEELTADV